MQITSLTLKNNRVQVFVDDRYAFSCTQNFVVEHRLYREMVVDDTFEELKYKAQLSIVEYKMIEYAMRARYSLKELQQKTTNYSKKRFDFTPNEEQFDKSFKKLVSLHLYNEETIIANWIKNYISKKKSKRFISGKLYLKGFNKDMINEQLDEINEKPFQNNLEILIQKKKNSLESKDLNIHELRQKLTSFAVSKGYDYTLTKQIINKLLN